MGKFVDLTGRSFGRLTVVGRAAGSKTTVKWMCVCACGGSTVVAGRALTRRNNATKSCGCLARETAAAISSARVKHGATVGGRSRAYTIWQNMRARCECPTNRSFADYGGRGITVDPRWASFEKFIEDMGEPPRGHEIERIDNERGYGPGNCRWATRKEQTRNTRRTRWIELNGVRRSLSEWCEIFGLPYYTVHSRITKLGWTPHEALTGRRQ